MSQAARVALQTAHLETVDVVANSSLVGQMAVSLRMPQVATVAGLTCSRVTAQTAQAEHQRRARAVLRSTSQAWEAAQAAVAQVV